MERLKLSDLLDLAIARHLQETTARISAGGKSWRLSGRPNALANSRVFINPYRRRPELSLVAETERGDVFEPGR